MNFKSKNHPKFFKNKTLCRAIFFVSLFCIVLLIPFTVNANDVIFIDFKQSSSENISKQNQSIIMDPKVVKFLIVDFHHSVYLENGIIHFYNHTPTTVFFDLRVLGSYINKDHIYKRVEQTSGVSSPKFKFTQGYEQKTCLPQTMITTVLNNQISSDFPIECFQNFKIPTSFIFRTTNASFPVYEISASYFQSNGCISCEFCIDARLNAGVIEYGLETESGLSLSNYCFQETAGNFGVISETLKSTIQALLHAPCNPACEETMIGEKASINNGKIWIGVVFARDQFSDKGVIETNSFPTASKNEDFSAKWYSNLLYAPLG